MTQKGMDAQKDLVLASLEEFATYGYEKSSINRICEQHKITKGQLYHHFKGKDSLYLACVALVYQTIQAYHHDHLEMTSDLEHNIEQYLRVRRDFLMEHTLMAMLFYRTLRGNPESLQVQIQALRNPFLEFNKSFFATILGDGHLAEDLEIDATIDYFMMVIEAYNAQLETIETQSMTEFMEHYNVSSARLIRMLLYGIVQRKEGNV